MSFEDEDENEGTKRENYITRMPTAQDCLNNYLMIPSVLASK